MQILTIFPAFNEQFDQLFDVVRQTMLEERKVIAVAYDTLANRSAGVRDAVNEIKFGLAFANKK